MIYFSTRKIPALRAYPALERLHIAANAAKNMPFGRKAVANILKVLLLVALFWSVLYIQGIALKLIAILALGLLYPLVLQPITLSLAAPYIPDAVREFERNKAYAQNEPSDNESPTDRGDDEGN
ncbi:hypothetical protein CWE08_09720 [Aliidiomarina iranensis]|uniref:Uncharacterized protein n=1 Tax=Aliidiomarina iranensis TaxID=1434071 RepID=A0A432VTF3_9GAMM|nr:DUF6170 family protein [Aliidiomarina iranensis]RUO19694.1 hypothetical protein CWE08_09720 [Aliidiomarina iranensis]